MAKILTYNSPKGIEEKARKQNPFKNVWDLFQSQDKFAKFSILTLLLVIIATPFIVNNLLETRQRAQTPPSPTTGKAPGPEYVTDQYIVVLKDKDTSGNKIDPEVEADDAVKTHGVQKKHVYKYALNGYAFHGSAQAAEALKQNPKVKYVVQDQKVHADQTVTPSPTPGPTYTGTPYGGTPWAVPGKIEAENYDNGGEGVAYHDTDTTNTGRAYRTDGVDIKSAPASEGSGYVVSLQPGEWLRFTVNVTTCNTTIYQPVCAYIFNLRVAALSPSHASCVYTYDGCAGSGFDIPATGSLDTYENVQYEQFFNHTGVQQMTLEAGAGGSFDVNYIDVAQGVIQPAQTLPTGIDRVDAEKATGTSFAPTPSFGVAVIDTGIDLTHPDLNTVDGINCFTPGTSAQDDAGHGTHVAGTIGAKNNDFGVVGVAPGVKLVAVKVLGSNGSGTWSAVICGVDYVTANVATIKVANMSLAGIAANGDDGNCGNTNNDPVHQAICRSVAAGVTHVVGAANANGDDIAGYIPAAYNEVITVTALLDSDGQPGGNGPTPPSGGPCGYGTDDNFATFTNYATSLDLPHTVGAPGVCIVSTVTGGGYDNKSGTSMASPHVAGAAAVYISLHPGIKPSQVMAAIRGSGETLGNGHTDSTCSSACNLHPEPVLNLPALYNYPVPSGGGTTPAPSPAPTQPGGGVSNINVSLTQPTNGAIIPLGKTIVLSALATDTPGVNITKVEFYVNGSRKCSDTSSPYTCNFKVPTTVGALYTITAKAYDITGNTKVSSPSNVTGGTDTVYPSVNLTSPINGANVTIGSVVPITATAQDTVGVSKVEFYVNGARKCSDTTAPYSCNWTVPTGTNISYNLNARGYDYAGNISNSSVQVVSK